MNIISALLSSPPRRRQPFRLLDLPGELQERICQLAVADEPPYEGRIAKSGTLGALCLVSRDVYALVRPLLWKHLCLHSTDVYLRTVGVVRAALTQDAIATATQSVKAVLYRPRRGDMHTLAAVSHTVGALREVLASAQTLQVVRVRSIHDELDAHVAILNAIAAMPTALRTLDLTIAYMLRTFDPSLPAFRAIGHAVARHAGTAEVVSLSHQVWTSRQDFLYDISSWLKLPCARKLTIDIPERLAPLRHLDSTPLPSLQHLTLRNIDAAWLLSLLDICPPPMNRLTLTYDTRYKSGPRSATLTLPPAIRHVRLYVDTVEPELLFVPLCLLHRSSVTTLDYAVSLSNYEIDDHPLDYFYRAVAPEIERSDFMPKLQRLRLLLRQFDGRARPNLLDRRDHRFRMLSDSLMMRGVEYVGLLDELGDLDRQSRPI